MIRVLPVGAEAIPGPSTAITGQSIREESKSKQVNIHRHGAGNTRESDTAMTSIV